jgi:ubiquinone/menaquinone biosynthesis C-methylase UbiE
MTRADHVELIRPGLSGVGGTWADLGAGAGVFTRALASVLGETALIFAVDREARALRALGEGSGARNPGIHGVHADFMSDVRLPALDGILMANSLHFVPDACAALRHVARWLKPDGRLILIEYDIDIPNTWVPYPVPWSRLPAAAACAGFSDPSLLGTRPSRYHRSVYAALVPRRGTGAKTV